MREQHLTDEQQEAIQRIAAFATNQHPSFSARLLSLGAELAADPEALKEHVENFYINSGIVEKAAKLHGEMVIADPSATMTLAGKLMSVCMHAPKEQREDIINILKAEVVYRREDQAPLQAKARASTSPRI